MLSDDGRPGAEGRWSIDASKEDTRLPRQLVLAFKTPVNAGTLRVNITSNSDLIGQSMGHFRLSTTSAQDPSWAVRIKHNLRANRDEKALATYFRTISKVLAPTRDELREVNNQIEKLDIPTALVMAEAAGTDRPSDFLRTRGGFSA